MKIVIGFIAVVMMFLLSGCGDRVEVPPAHLGKILTKAGYKPDTIPPSKFRLEPCLWYCDKLILVQASDTPAKEVFKLFMPEDQLNMSFDIQFTMSIDTSPKSINSIYNRIPSKKYQDYDEPLIAAVTVYNTYGKPVLREVIRTVVAKYSINEVATNRERLSQEVFQSVTKALEGQPIIIKRMGFADLQFPEVITKAKEDAAENRIQIDREKAKKQVEMVRLQTELEKAKMQQNIRRVQAQSALEENKIFAKSVTKEYIAYKQLEVLKALADNNNTVFLPMTALDSIGVQQRIFGLKNQNPAIK